MNPCFLRHSLHFGREINHTPRRVSERRAVASDARGGITPAPVTQTILPADFGLWTGPHDKESERAHMLALGRAPTPAEHERLIAFAKANGLPNLCRVLLNLNEFTFVD